MGASGSRKRKVGIRYGFLAIAVGFVLSILPYESWSALTAPVGLEEVLKGSVPDSLVYFSPDPSEYALLIEKSTQTAYLYRSDKLEKPFKIYDCSTGENHGAKFQNRDKRTPEGIYFITKVFEEKALSPTYGACALPINYPNKKDKKQGKKGYGIWLHGTNQELKPRDTNGCVVFNNSDIFEISKYLTKGRSPVIITEKLNFIPKEELQREKGKLEDFIMEWARAWQEKEIDEYMSFYFKEFTGKGKNWHEWKAYKKRLSEKYKDIDINIDNLRIFKENGVALAKFDQTYKAGAFFSFGEKELYLKRLSSQWNIVDEFFKNKPLVASKVSKPSKPRPSVDSEKEIHAIKAMISAWKNCWQNKELQGYMDRYSLDFSSQGMDREAWKRHKAQINREYERIKVAIKDLKVNIASPDRATVRFYQVYSSDKYKDAGIKTLQLVKRGGEWKIRREIWSPVKESRKR